MYRLSQAQTWKLDSCIYAANYLPERIDLELCETQRAFWVNGSVDGGKTWAALIANFSKRASKQSGFDVVCSMREYVDSRCFAKRGVRPL